MDILSRCLVAQFVQGKPPGRSMSFLAFEKMMADYQPDDEARQKLRASAKAMRRALDRAEQGIVQAMGARVAAGLLKAPCDPLLAKALTAMEDYIGEDRKTAVAFWVGIIGLGYSLGEGLAA